MLQSLIDKVLKMDTVVGMIESAQVYAVTMTTTMKIKGFVFLKQNHTVVLAEVKSWESPCGP